MLSDNDKKALHARLFLIEALTVMLVGELYVGKASADPDTDAMQMVAHDVRTWFDRIADTSDCDPARLDFEATRIFGAIEQHVAQRLAR